MDAAFEGPSDGSRAALDDASSEAVARVVAAVLVGIGDELLGLRRGIAAALGDHPAELAALAEIDGMIARIQEQRAAIAFDRRDGGFVERTCCGLAALGREFLATRQRADEATAALHEARRTLTRGVRE